MINQIKLKLQIITKTNLFYTMFDKVLKIYANSFGFWYVENSYYPMITIKLNGMGDDFHLILLTQEHYL